MRLLVIDKTAVLASVHERFEKLARVPDVELCVLCPSRWPEHMREVVAERTSHPDYQIRLAPTFWSGSYSRGFYIRGVEQALIDFRPDVIQLLEEPWSFFAGQVIRAKRRVAPNAQLLFYTWENIYRENTYCSKLDTIHRRIETAVFEGSVSGVCATQTASKVLQRRGYRGERPVIPYGIHSDFFLDESAIQSRSLRPMAEIPRIGYVGRLLPMKGVDTLIQALPGTAGRLSILGSGEAEPDLRRVAAETGVTDRIDWTAAIPPDQVPAFIRSLDVLVLPSRTTRVWAEQLGRVMLEAMASGVPVIGSSSGCILEVIGADGWVFREGDAEDLAARIDSVVRETETRTRRIHSAWAKVRDRYTWDRFVADLVTHYRTLAGRNP